MIDYIYLGLTVVFFSSASIFGGLHSKANKDLKNTTNLYNLSRIVAVFLGWAILFAINPSFDVKVLPYAILFGLGFAICAMGHYNAINTGSIVLSSLILQLSLILTTVWGFFFWGAKFTLLSGLGLTLAVIAIYLCLNNGKEKEQKKKFSFKWLIFALMSMFGNAVCTISQRTQQIKFNGEHGNMLMLFGIAIAVIFYVVDFLRIDKVDAPKMFKSYTIVYPLLDGIFNVLVNLFMIILATSTLSTNIIYPVIAVVGISLVSLFSFVVFKEKLKWWQWVGIAVGVVAVVMLSI
jgi:uncharacterized membrane protein